MAVVVHLITTTLHGGMDLAGLEVLGVLTEQVDIRMLGIGLVLVVTTTITEHYTLNNHGIFKSRSKATNR